MEPIRGYSNVSPAESALYHTCILYTHTHRNTLIHTNTDAQSEGAQEADRGSL